MNPPSLLTTCPAGHIHVHAHPYLITTINEVLPPEVLTQILTDVGLEGLEGLVRSVCKHWNAIILYLAGRRPVISLRCITQWWNTAAWSIREKPSKIVALKPSESRQPPDYCWIYALAEAAGYHGGELMNMMLAKHIRAGTTPQMLFCQEDLHKRVIVGAIKGGRVDVLDLLLRTFRGEFMHVFHRKLHHAEKWAIAAVRGRIQVMNWMKHKCRAFDESEVTSVCGAARFGRLDTLEWYWANSRDRIKLFTAPVILSEAARCGQLGVVQWLRGLFAPPPPWPEDVDIVELAVESGNTDLVRWLETSYSWDAFRVWDLKRAMKAAARQGHVEMAQLVAEVVQRRCMLDDSEIRQGYLCAADYAAIYGRADILQWVKEHVGGPLHETLPEFNAMAHMLGRTILATNTAPTPCVRLEKYHEVAVPNEDVDRFLLEEHALCLSAKHPGVFEELLRTGEKKRKRSEE